MMSDSGLPAMRSRQTAGSVFLLAVLLLSPFAAGAQQTDQPAQITPPPAEAGARTPAPTPTPAPPPARPDESFVPSETISEDLSVPFPVDI